MAIKQQCYTQDGENIAANGTDKASNSALTSSLTPSTSSTQSDNIVKKAVRNLDGLVDSFTEAVEVASAYVDTKTSKLNAIDCSSKLSDYIKTHVPMYATAMNYVDNFSGYHKMTADFGLGSFGTATDFGKTICAFIEKWFGIFNGIVDIALKSALVLFKRIDAARERLENATLSLTDAIMKCVIDVVDAIANKAFAILNVGATIDWNSLLDLMVKCPCVAVVVAKMTGCDKVDGVDITNNPARIIQCIKESSIFTNPIELKTTIDKIVDKYVKKYIVMIFGALEYWIDYVFKMLIRPLRSLIKKYIDLLTKKTDVTAFIKSVGSYKCFFTYTEEYKNGNKYYGMSVIDIVNTYKSWIACLSVICPGLSEKIKNHTKQMYKDLRLDDKYWRRAQEADLYMVCVAAKIDANVSRETILRGLYAKSCWDDLKALVDRLLHNGDDVDESTEILENFNLEQPLDIDMTVETLTPSAISQTVILTSAPDGENEINKGTNPITAREEDALMSIATTLTSEVGDPYYTEHFYQLIRFGNKYATSDKYIDHMKQAMAKTEQMSGQFAKSSGCTLPESRNREPDYINDPMGQATVENPSMNETVRPTYYIRNDFYIDRYRRISEYLFTPQYEGESLADWYVRMFTSVG